MSPLENYYDSENSRIFKISNRSSWQKRLGKPNQLYNRRQILAPITEFLDLFYTIVCTGGEQYYFSKLIEKLFFQQFQFSIVSLSSPFV
jgi:hypothetical protein